MRDTIENAVKRSAAFLTDHDYTQAIAECDAAEAQFGNHWLFDFFRGFALHGQRRFQEAEDVWCRADAHYVYDPRFPCSPSQLIPYYLAVFSAEQKDYPNAFRYINRFLSGNTDEIFGLFFRGKLTASLAEGMDDETLRMGHFTAATEDFQQAYTLIRSITDDKLYVFKYMRDTVGTHYDEAVNLLEDVVNVNFISNFLSHFTTIVNTAEAPVLEAENLFGAVMPADPMQIEIGLALARSLTEIDAPLKEILILLKEISSVACRNEEFIWHTFILLVIVSAHIDMHNEQADSNDNDNYLQEAESVFADFLRLAYQHQIYDILAEEIEKIETILQTLRSEEI